MNRFFIECQALSEVYVFGIVPEFVADEKLRFESKPEWIPASHAHQEMLAVLAQGEMSSDIQFYSGRAICLFGADQIRLAYIRASAGLEGKDYLNGKTLVAKRVLGLEGGRINSKAVPFIELPQSTKKLPMGLPSALRLVAINHHGSRR